MLGLLTILYNSRVRVLFATVLCCASLASWKDSHRLAGSAPMLGHVQREAHASTPAGPAHTECRWQRHRFFRVQVAAALLFPRAGGSGTASTRTITVRARAGRLAPSPSAAAATTHSASRGSSRTRCPSQRSSLPPRWRGQDEAPASDSTGTAPRRQSRRRRHCLARYPTFRGWRAAAERPHRRPLGRQVFSPPLDPLGLAPSPVC